MAAFVLSPAASYLTGDDDRRRRRRAPLAVKDPLAPARSPVLVACAHGTRNPTGRRLIAELALAARALRPGLTTTAAFVDVQPPDRRRRRRRSSRRPAGRRSSCRCCCRAGTTCTSTSPGPWPRAGHGRRPPARPGPPAGRGAARPAGRRPAPIPRDPLTAVVVAAAGSSDTRAVADVEDTADLLQRTWAGPGDDRLRVGRAADRARRGGRRPPRAARSGSSSRPTCWRPDTSTTSSPARAPTRSPLPCCPTSGSPPSCSTATTRLARPTDRGPASGP